jgi:uncharacterized membrane protein YphA (DoxX/SURF4 family)
MNQPVRAARPGAEGVQEPASGRSWLEEDHSRQMGVGWWIRRLGVRFGALYAIFFVAVRSAGVVPDARGIAAYYYHFKVKCVAWVGTHVFRFDQPITHLPHGSGDQIFDWILVLSLLGLALIGAVVWMFFDRASRYERIVVELVRIVLRFRLGITMLRYGIEKVFRDQMPEPGISKLLQPFGESSPMGLLWTFMGQSWAYSAFTGGLEVLGGLLLFFRRTTTLGALMVVAVMLNVLMMNFCFDVPVKLFSIHYLIFAAALAAPDVRRIADVLVFNRAVKSVTVAPVWPLGRVARVVPFVKALAVGTILWYIPIRATWRWIEIPRPATSDLHGVYEVEKFSRDGTDAPPLTTDTQRWRRVGFDHGDQVTLVFMNDARAKFSLRRGPNTGQFMLQAVEGDYARGEVLSYVRRDADHVSIKGTLNHNVVLIELHRTDPEKLLLRERGFRWVSEYPLNR